MTIYALKRYPDNLSAVLDTLDKHAVEVSDFRAILQSSGWLLSLNEDRIPEHTLTVILLMIAGYATKINLNFKDPAVDLSDLSQMYPYVMNVYPIHTAMEITIIKDRDPIPAYGDVLVNSAIDETVPEKTRDRIGEDSEATPDSNISQKS